MIKIDTSEAYSESELTEQLQLFYKMGFKIICVYPIQKEQISTDFDYKIVFERHFSNSQKK